jgi:hypothetical protein
MSHEESAEFAEYLQRRSLLPPERGSLQPPAALDDLILEHARNAVGPAARRRRAWAIPVALAATVLLSLSIVLNVSLNSSRVPPAAAPAEANEPVASSAQRAAEPAAPALQKAAPLARETSSSAPARSDPQQWWERIVRLRAAGRVREADAELAQLRTAYPGFAPANGGAAADAADAKAARPASVPPPK